MFQQQPLGHVYVLSSNLPRLRHMVKVGSSRNFWKNRLQHHLNCYGQQLRVRTFRTTAWSEVERLLHEFLQINNAFPVKTITCARGHQHREWFAIDCKISSFYAVVQKYISQGCADACGSTEGNTQLFVSTKHKKNKAQKKQKTKPQHLQQQTINKTNLHLIPFVN